MRNNPSNPSTIDPYDKLPAAEKASSEPAAANTVFGARPDSNVLPIPTKAMVRSPTNSITFSKRDTALRAEGNTSWQLPMLLLGHESLSDNMPFAPLPDVYLSLQPHVAPTMVQPIAE